MAKMCGNFGAHLNIDVDEATVRNGYAGLFGADLLAVGRADHGLQVRGFEGGSARLASPRRGRKVATLFKSNVIPGEAAMQAHFGHTSALLSNRRLPATISRAVRATENAARNQKKMFSMN